MHHLKAFYTIMQQNNSQNGKNNCIFICLNCGLHVVWLLVSVPHLSFIILVSWSGFFSLLPDCCVMSRCCQIVSCWFSLVFGLALHPFRRGIVSGSVSSAGLLLRLWPNPDTRVSSRMRVSLSSQSTCYHVLVTLLSGSFRIRISLINQVCADKQRIVGFLSGSAYTHVYISSVGG